MSRPRSGHLGSLVYMLENLTQLSSGLTIKAVIFQISLAMLNGAHGIMCRESLDVKLSDCKEFRSFEFSEWNVQVHKRTIKVVTIYRAPYSEDHPVSSHVFFDEFSSYLENTVMAPEVLLITGDFNFHIDCPSDADAKTFADLLDTFGLIQHVQVPTHSSGHTLDLIITRSTNDVTITSPLTTFALSDHSFIECFRIFIVLAL